MLLLSIHKAVVIDSRHTRYLLNRNRPASTDMGTGPNLLTINLVTTVKSSLFCSMFTSYFDSIFSLHINATFQFKVYSVIQLHVSAF
jgi:hypothetical protein